MENNIENWCSHFVQFTGSPESLKEIEWLFRAMSALEKETQQGQRPPFIKNNDGCLCNIDLFDKKVYFETIATPNIDLLTQVADRFQTGFILDYHELGHSIFGEATYDQGKIHDIRLDIEDFEKFNYDLEEQAYMFEGFYYDSDAEILEIMLEMKKDQLNKPYSRRR